MSEDDQDDYWHYDEDEENMSDNGDSFYAVRDDRGEVARLTLSPHWHARLVNYPHGKKILSLAKAFIQEVVRISSTASAPKPQRKRTKKR